MPVDDHAQPAATAPGLLPSALRVVDAPGRAVGRRVLLGGLAVAGVSAAAACGRPGTRTVWTTPAASEPAGTGAGVKPAVKPAPNRSAPIPKRVRTDAPYADAVTDVLTKYLKPTSDNPRHPGYAGAVALVMVGGRTTLRTAVGDAVRYQAGPVELPAGQRVKMTEDAIFDLASLTKVYTAILVLQLVDRGKVELDAPVRRYLPDFTGAGKETVTVAMLLAHTSALPVGAKVTGMSSNTARWASVMSTPLVPGGKPGTTFRYSSVGLMVLGRLVEKLTGKPLDKAVRDLITTPMGLPDTGFTPLKWAPKDRLVATDARTSRGLLRGTVHDDVCDILGGVAGHAGIFGTAQEVAAIGEMLRIGGTYNGRRILSAGVVRTALTNVNDGKPAIDAERPGRSADHGLGVEMNQPWFMGRLSTPTSFGHTGFTGTALLVVPSREMVVVLLTNRAHPNWSWSDPDTHRVAVANAIAAA